MSPDTRAALLSACEEALEEIESWTRAGALTNKDIALRQRIRAAIAEARGAA